MGLEGLASAAALTAGNICGDLQHPFSTGYSSVVGNDHNPFVTQLSISTLPINLSSSHSSGPYEQSSPNASSITSMSTPSITSVSSSTSGTTSVGAASTSSSSSSSSSTSSPSAAHLSQINCLPETILCVSRRNRHLHPRTDFVYEDTLEVPTVTNPLNSLKETHLCRYKVFRLWNVKDECKSSTKQPRCKLFYCCFCQQIKWAKLGNFTRGHKSKRCQRGMNGWCGPIIDDLANQMPQPVKKKRVLQQEKDIPALFFKAWNEGGVSLTNMIHEIVDKNVVFTEEWITIKGRARLHTYLNFTYQSLFASSLLDKKYPVTIWALNSTDGTAVFCYIKQRYEFYVGHRYTSLNGGTAALASSVPPIGEYPYEAAVQFHIVDGKIVRYSAVSPSLHATLKKTFGFQQWPNLSVSQWCHATISRNGSTSELAAVKTDYPYDSDDDTDEDDYLSPSNSAMEPSSGLMFPTSLTSASEHPHYSALEHVLQTKIQELERELSEAKSVLIERERLLDAIMFQEIGPESLNHLTEPQLDIFETPSYHGDSMSLNSTFNFNGQSHNHNHSHNHSQNQSHNHGHNQSQSPSNLGPSAFNLPDFIDTQDLFSPTGSSGLLGPLTPRSSTSFFSGFNFLN